MKPSIVDLNSCHELKNTDKPFILLLRKDEKLFESVIKAAEIMHIQAASISGLGALDDVTVAYYDLPRKEYKTKLFHGMFELISLNGNIAMVDGKPFVHIHATLGTENYEVIGGHIMDATVGVVVEMTVIPLPATLSREYDANLGLKILCPMHPANA